MENKFNMSVRNNIIFAKRNIIDLIYNSSKLEGLNITFPETYAIFEKATINNANIDTINTVLNLKHSWQYLFKTLDNELDLDYLLKMNYEISKDESLDWGVLRYGNSGISGTEYKPPIPIKEKVIEELNILKNIDNSTQRALNIMLWIMKSQLFWDGNKRTAMIIANKELIRNGNGVISVPIDLIMEFNEKLSNYYTDDKNKETLIKFLYDKCISGLEI